MRTILHALIIAAIIVPCLYFAPSANPRVLVVGDSWAFLSPVDGDKCFVSGGSIEEISAKLDNAPESARDEVVIILAGMADMKYRKRPLKETQEAVTALADKAKARFHCPVISADPASMLTIWNAPEHRSFTAHINEQGYKMLFDELCILDLFSPTKGLFERPYTKPLPVSVF